MIIHRYSEYEEPQRPPFTLDELIRAITDMMMRHGMNFDEAFRSILEQGLPINQFLRDDALDKSLDELISQVKESKDNLAKKYDFPGYTHELQKRFQGQASDMADLASRNPAFLDKLTEAA
ncbi:MAG: hypothetical protein OEZ04_08895, partial [Nitrospinota bacterium]|nr:hypothetical protein [Nitrospinota bacterium]